jgi:hypothetical protein
MLKAPVRSEKHCSTPLGVEALTAVVINVAIFWDISPCIAFIFRIEKLSGCVGFEVFTAVTVNNAVFWDVSPCGSCKNRRFGVP